MIEAKIQFSTAEIELINNADIILTKNTALQKINSMLAALAEMQKNFLLQHHIDCNHTPWHIPPKISKGENYLGLPFRVLDYPRLFQKEKTLAIRTMFWWGHFFSCTLQASGDAKTIFLKRLIENFDEFVSRNLYIGTNDDPWVHHFREDNFQPLAIADKEKLAAKLLSMPHIKIAAQWPLAKGQYTATELFDGWKFFAGLVLTRQDDEKDLSPGDPRDGFDL